MDPSASWLENLIIKSAVEVDVRGQAIFQFSSAIRQGLEQRPIQAWEMDRWARGLKRGLIRMEGHFFRVGTGKRSSLSFFVRSEGDRYVGLRRESITQAATFVTLITDYGYPRESTRFETGWMDVAVYDKEKKPFIYAENKAHEKTLEKLCRRLESEFHEDIPFPGPAEEIQRRPNDALMKAHHLWRHRPRYFWAVCPTQRQAYEVRYHAHGFDLGRVPSLPAALEWERVEVAA